MYDYIPKRNAHYIYINDVSHSVSLIWSTQFHKPPAISTEMRVFTIKNVVESIVELFLGFIGFRIRMV